MFWRTLRPQGNLRAIRATHYRRCQGGSEQRVFTLTVPTVVQIISKRDCICNQSVFLHALNDSEWLRHLNKLLPAGYLGFPAILQERWDSFALYSVQLSPDSQENFVYYWVPRRKPNFAYLQRYTTRQCTPAASLRNFTWCIDKLVQYLTVAGSNIHSPLRFPVSAVTSIYTSRILCASPCSNLLFVQFCPSSVWYVRPLIHCFPIDPLLLDIWTFY